MSLTYQLETWAQYWPDAAVLWTDHWREIAMHQDIIPLDVDMDAYAALDAQSALHIVTMRENGLLVGYHLTVVKPHLHYKSTLHGFVDIYWVHPDYRRGLAGYRLFQVVDASLKARGVVKVITACKVSLDVSMLFARLGYTETERTWTKLLKE